MASSPVFIGIHGNVFCLDRGTGRQIWGIGLKNMGFVTLLVDGDLLIAATSGEVWGLDKATGAIRWHNEMPGQGLGIASIATETSSSNAAAPEQVTEQQQQAAATIATIR